MLRLFLPVVLLLFAGYSSLAQNTVSSIESLYADWDDAVAALSTIDSGYRPDFDGHDRAYWQKRSETSREQLVRLLPSATPGKSAPGDARALTLMKASLASSSDSEPSKAHCSEAKNSTLDYSHLRRALYACFEEVGDHLSLQGRDLTRGAAFGKLEQLADPSERKHVFMALAPLYEAINGRDEVDSPYRRLLKQAAAQKTSEIENAAKTLGVGAGDVENWLERILDMWRRATPDREVEPWDYRFENGEAGRLLDHGITRDLLLEANERYYRDLGADLHQLGVIEDIDPRPGKSPVAYTDFARRGRMIDGKWQPTVARVLATYPQGSLGSLNEYVHENGHAVQISAIHTRPAFMDWGDTLFVEAFADVTSWNTYDAAWQRKYLGESAPQAANLRNLYGGVMLDVAWALFEIRMLKVPGSDPNVVWCDITHRYLHIKKHPELSWWAVRGQLVDAPGYMVNYGLGAVLTADLRARITEQVGPFVEGNPKWYPWLTEHLLRFGSEEETSVLLRRFLGRPVSPEALVRGLGTIERP